ncbi:MAG TPA: response regulator transcription factor [Bacteroidales bacterium]|jgi:DNA-binding response OmpR family regulator|nr:response regulator transcription factor [Bacteroidales bacterium]
MEKDKRILIVDDEEDLCEILRYNLSTEGYTTDIALSAEEALKKDISDFDLVILDIMMGEMSGFKMADKLRKEMQSDIPVIFLTARDTENDLLTGFSLGADDYITKPFSVNELKARVRAVLNRTESGSKKTGRNSYTENIEFDHTRKKVLVEGNPLELTKKEYELLFLLVNGNGKVFSREDILQRIWGDDVVVTDRTVDVNITRLRNKMGKYGAYLKNKTGYGYYFEIN